MIVASQLGDYICFEGDCQQGQSMVEQMQSTFASLGGPSQWQAQVDAINQAYQDAQSSWQREIPFTPICCSIKYLGNQAQTLTNMMLTASGLTPLPVITPSKGFFEDLGGSASTLLKVVGWTAVAGVVLIGGLLIYEAAATGTVTSRLTRKKKA